MLHRVLKNTYFWLKCLFSGFIFVFFTSSSHILSGLISIFCPVFFSLQDLCAVGDAEFISQSHDSLCGAHYRRIRWQNIFSSFSRTIEKSLPKWNDNHSIEKYSKVISQKLRLCRSHVSGTTGEGEWGRIPK